MCTYIMHWTTRTHIMHTAIQIRTSEQMSALGSDGVFFCWCVFSFLIFLHLNLLLYLLLAFWFSFGCFAKGRHWAAGRVLCLWIQKVANHPTLKKHYNFILLVKNIGVWTWRKELYSLVINHYSCILLNYLFNIVGVYVDVGLMCCMCIEGVLVVDILAVSLFWQVVVVVVFAKMFAKIIHSCELWSEYL